MLIAILAICIITFILSLFLLFNSKKGLNQEDLKIIKDTTISDLTKEIRYNTELQLQQSKAQTEGVGLGFRTLQDGVNNQIRQMQETINRLEETTQEQLRFLNDTMNRGMKELKNETHDQLQEIKGTVDEQLQTNLEKKIQESFRTVSEQLASVQRGLGEMTNLASSVGDLKKTLTNVKQRGIFGELQLGTILEQILAPEQYEKNVVTVKGTSNPVEFAIKLPGEGNDKFVYLPIDSKFPLDSFNNLLDAYEKGDALMIQEHGKILENRILQEAKDIHTKYVHVPETTEFAIMFLPTESLYAEVLKRGMLEKLQEKYKIMIAGPTTMAALLNSLQMGFRTLTISQRANEVVNLLNNVKTEFGKYQQAVESVSKKFRQTNDEFENLVGVRTRQLARQLDKVSTSDFSDQKITNNISSLPFNQDVQ